MKLSSISNGILNKKKNFTEFLDFGKIYKSKKEENYHRTFEENQNYFKKNIGIFTNIIDLAHRNGNLIQPFGNNKNISKMIKSNSKGEDNNSSLLNNNYKK